MDKGEILFVCLLCKYAFIFFVADFNDLPGNSKMRAFNSRTSKSGTLWKEVAVTWFQMPRYS